MANSSFKQKLVRFKSQFGVDPFKDLKSLTTNIKIAQPGKEPEILMHIVGTFNQQKFLQGLTQEGNVFEQETIQGKVAHISAANKSALSFVSDGVIMGTPALIRSALKGVQFGGALAEQQAKLIHGGDLWFVAHIPEEIRAQLKLSNPTVADSKATRGYLDFAQGLHVMMTTEFASTGGAAQAATILGQVIAQAKQSPQAAMFMNMVNKFSVKTQGSSLMIDLPLSQEDVDQIQAIVSMLLMSLSMKQAEQSKPTIAPQRPSFPQLNQPIAPTVAPSAPPPVAPMPSTATPNKVQPTP